MNKLSFLLDITLRSTSYMYLYVKEFFNAANVWNGRAHENHVMVWRLSGIFLSLSQDMVDLLLTTLPVLKYPFLPYLYA